MESSSHIDEKLEAFLLNELPDDELAALQDELLRDDELYQRLETMEMNLIDRYLENELTGDEKQRFEAEFLSNPANQLKLHEARVFRESLEKLGEGNNAAPNVASIPGLRKKFFDSVHLPQLAAAAVILIMIALLIAWFAYRSRNEQPAPVSTQVVPLPTPESSPTPAQQPSPAPATSPPQRKPADKIHEQWLYLRDANAGVMGPGDDLPVPLTPDTETLRLRFELLDDTLGKKSFRVSIKDRMGYPALSPMEVTPIQILHRGLRRRAISVDVPVRALKIGEQYRFEIADPYAFKTFVIEKGKPR